MTDNCMIEKKTLVLIDLLRNILTHHVVHKNRPIILFKEVYHPKFFGNFLSIRS